jgi:EmrB/QacA subfamily drug resistance transporter
VDSGDLQTGSGARWVLALTSVASLMVSLDNQVVATALPAIRVNLHASLGELEWVVNAYTLSFAVLLMTGAALGDRLGRRRMLAAGLGLFTAASAACALAPSAGALIAARAVQGAGAAVVLPLALALVSAAFPPQRRARAIGAFSGVTGLAVLAGPVIGGAVTQGLSWPWIFWLNVPIGLVLAPLVLARIPESTGPSRRLDLGGLALATGGALGLAWGLIRANTVGWRSPQVILALVAGLALATAFVAWERRAPEPMLPLRLFRSRVFSTGNTAGFLMFAALFGLLFFMTQYLQTALGYGPLAAGLRLLPGWGTVFVVSPFAGALAGRVGERPLVAGGMALFAAGLGWEALIARTGLPYRDLVAPLIVAGVGVSTALAPAQSTVMSAVPAGAIGKASGTFNTLRQLGGVFGIAICAAVFAANGSYASPAAFTAGFGPAMAVCAGLALAGSIAGLGTAGRARRAASSGHSEQGHRVPDTAAAGPAKQIARSPATS